MTPTLIKTPAQGGPTTESDHDSNDIAGPAPRRSKARTRRQISRITELRWNVADLADSDIKQGAAAEELCSLFDRDRPVLSEVYLAQLRHMRNRPADDFHATATLGIIERALALLPRPVPPFAPPRWAPPAPRRFRWLGLRRT